MSHRFVVLAEVTARLHEMKVEHALKHARLLTVLHVSDDAGRAASVPECLSDTDAADSPYRNRSTFAL